MGCTPSHISTANHNAKHGSKLLNKGILSVDPESEGVSLQSLIKGSSSYDTDDLYQGETQGKDHSLDNTSDEDKNVNFHSSSKDPSLPEAEQEEKDIDRLVSETEIAMSELTESHQYVAGNMKIKRQNSCKSRKAVLEDKNENNEKQNPKRGKKQKNSRQGKQNRHCKIKEKSCASICKEEKKVDFPDLLVKAHKNTYAYLNPNLSKYEIILWMAHQATETQLILQQMVSFFLLRFDEINHLLEEIAKDGEDLLKEVGGNLSWPADKGNPKEQPDLLQQLLQYTVNKMQLLNGTVASLTSEVLQEFCSFLQSAGSSLEEKLKTKQGFDERLLRTIKLLEASTAGSSHPHPDDRALCSEDSGIGADTESVKDLNFPDKQGIHANCVSCSPYHSLNETIWNGTASAREQQWMCTSVYATSKSHDCAAERRFKDIVYPPAHITSSSERGAECIDTVLQHQNIDIRMSLNSGHSDAIHVDEREEYESTDASSTTEDHDNNSLSEEESDSTLEKRKNALPKRPTTAPLSNDIKQRLSTKRMESPEKEEIILKMKDAISEKIKFVPARTGKREWTEDENGRGAQVQRPSTATGSQKTKVKQRRSRSAESLRSHAEDPTLLELQRTQKDLNKKLEMFYTHNENKETKHKMTTLNQKEQSKLQDYEEVVHRSATNKLKASLAKNFSILPNQDKVPLLRHDQNALSKKSDGRKCRKLVTTTTIAQDQTSSRENEPLGTQRVNNVACAPPHKSVKKLIETFTPAEGLIKPVSVRTLGPIKCIRKFGLPSITPNLPLPRGLNPLNQKSRVSPIGDTNCGNDANEEFDEDYIENLPPPPPEMLVGLSVDSTESPEDARIEDNYSEIANKPTKMTEHCTTKKISQISQRMKASLFFIDLLPSKNRNSPNCIAKKTSKNTMGSTPRKYSLELNSTQMSDYHQETPLTSHRDYEMKEAADLYRQNHKIIPLQNPKEIPEQKGSDTASKECKAPLALAQKQGSLNSIGKSEKTTGFVQRVSPARTPPSSPPSEKRLPSPPLHHKHIHQAFSPIVYRQPSPPASPKAISPPTHRKLPSPPTQQKLPSPPMGRKQHSPPTRRKVFSPPSHRREPSPPPFSMTPSPPASPSRLHKGLQNNLDSGDEQQPASPKIVSNAHSIFCPATSSLFEAKPPLPSNNSTTDAILKGHSELSTQRNNTHPMLCGEQQKRMAVNVANPQPFIRRSFSDRRPGFPLPIPLFTSAASEPVLSQASMEEKLRKEGDSWNSACFSEVKGTVKSSSHLELYIVGQGLQKD
ncbi:photoreceptor cilium actin regulator [Eublepharis macularius]|uniref:Photoreceptor cilium actin regulator n=1 Tax=Eublepharis macularius TaxID=481883 RepID=A0AA97K864_EUBMA|nr:photoreceptor cilium actin regulator [Eublepharis macularius]